jgi:hypothetical protein
MPCLCAESINKNIGHYLKKFQNFFSLSPKDKKWRKTFLKHSVKIDEIAGGVVYVVPSSPPATEETGAMDHEIESRQDLGW